MEDKRVVTVSEGGIMKEKFAANLPNIRSIQGFMKGQWDLSMFDMCFPKKNRLGDVDGSIELNGHTLHVEYKEHYATMNSGQVIKAYNQAVHSNITTVFVFGKTNQPVGYVVFSPKVPEGTDYVEADVNAVRQLFAEWAKYATENNLVTDRNKLWEVASKHCGRKF